MKKWISVLMVLVTVVCTCTFFAHGEEPFTIMTRFHTVQKGTAIEDLPSTVEITPEKMHYVPDSLSVFDFAGHAYSGELKPGHTYYMECKFQFDSDFTVPEGFTAEGFLRTADAFVRIITFNCFWSTSNILSTYTVTRFMVPGTPWQIISGRVTDWFGKLGSNFFGI